MNAKIIGRIALASLLSISASSHSTTHGTTSASKSQSQAWADVVTAFMLDPLLDGTFTKSEIAHRFRNLIAPSTLKTDELYGGYYPLGSNLANGVISVVGNMEATRHGPKGSMWINSMVIFMPRIDRDGNDVFACVKATMKRKMPTTWGFSADPDQSYHWVQKKSRLGSFLDIGVRLRESDPQTDGTPNAGPWVQVELGRSYDANSEERD